MPGAHVTYAFQVGQPARKWPRYRGLSASPQHRANSWQRYVGSVWRPPLARPCVQIPGRLLVQAPPTFVPHRDCGCATMGDPVSDIFDILTGGPQKRERTAKANRDAALAARDAAIAQAKSAVEVAQINLAYQQQMWDQAKELIIKGGVVAAAGFAAYLVLR